MRWDVFLVSPRSKMKGRPVGLSSSFCGNGWCVPDCLGAKAI